MRRSILHRSSEEWNAPVYRSGATNHLESYFVKGNDPATRRAWWIKFTVYAPRRDPQAAVGESWAVLFDPSANQVIGAKLVLPIAGTTWQSRPFRVQVGDCMLEQGGTRGCLTAADGTPIAWDLAWDPVSTPLVPFPLALMYTGRLPKTKAVSPHPDSRHSGFIRVGSLTWDLAGAPGMQGHNWGREHAFRYAWAHCNAFDSAPHVVFEAFSARVRVGRWTTPFLSAAILRLNDGREFRFNKAGAMLSRQIEVTHTGYSFTWTVDGWTLKGHLEARPEWMAGLIYRNPDGIVASCLNSKTADIEIALTGHGERHSWSGSQAAALETLTHDRSHPVRMIL